MTLGIDQITIDTALPDHTQLPESDGTFVKNFQEHPQSILLTDSIESVLQNLHSDGQFCIGQDSGIYWRLTEPREGKRRTGTSNNRKVSSAVESNGN